MPAPPLGSEPAMVKIAGGPIFFSTMTVPSFVTDRQTAVVVIVDSPIQCTVTAMVYH